MKRKIYKTSVQFRSLVCAFVLMALVNTVYAQTTYTFNYTGSSQTISLPAGNYSLQCWGADGGNANGGTTPTTGGKGGFATGVFSNPSTATFNVYVGGHGGNASGASNVGGGGGGMSDMAPASNTTLIIIAAGGGGGATSGISSESSTGGDGGGLVGGTAIDNTGVSTGTAASGGSQTAGGVALAGSYGAGSPGGYGYGGGSANGTSNPASPSGTIHAGGGIGGNGGNGGWNGGGAGCTSTGGNDHAAGGGAGYYGGGGGRGDGGAGGGGSSYIGGVTSGTTIMFGQPGFLSNPDPIGHGLVRIIELCNFDLYAMATTNSLNPIICAGQSATLTSNAVSNYSWSTGATSSSIVIAPTTNTVYSLVATSSLNCSTARTISITVSAGLPVLSISNPSNVLCLGQSATLTASGALSYTWTNPGVVNGQTFAPVATANYTVTGTNGCGTGSAVTTITVAPLTVTASASSSLVCEGTTASLTAVAAVNGYTWEPGTITSSMAIVAPAATTIYTVTASDGICSGTQTLLLQTKTTPTIAITPTVVTMCLGETATLTANGAGIGGSYAWSPGNGTNAIYTVSPSSSTLFVVVGTNSLNCNASAQVPVIIELPLPLTISTNATLVCNGASVTLNASGSTSYSWTNGPSTSNYLVNPTAALTVYTVTGFNTVNTCTATRTIAIAAITPSVVVSTPVNICLGNTATVTAVGANSYTWNGVPTGSLNIFTASPLQTSTFSLLANTNSLGVNCLSTHSVVINVNPNPTVTIGATRNIICKGESNTLTATGAATYVWQGSLGTASSVVVNPTSTTFYTVSGISSLGCSTTAQITAIVNTCNGIDFIANTARIEVYPNPNQGVFTITAESNMKISIINALGQVVRSAELNEENGFKFEIQELAKGLYYVAEANDTGKTKGVKIIVD